jgi:hypothetical protein
MPKLADKLPAALANRLQTRVGKQFTRFALVAIVSLAASEVTLGIAYLSGVPSGRSGLMGWLVGAATSYVLSRWAWRIKGRPHLLKETLPFWAISIGTAIVLSTTTHYAGVYAKSHHMSGFDGLAVVGTAYLVANFLTFMTRFLIFHYVLFADRGKQAKDPVEAESLSPVSVPAGSEDQEEDRRLG